MKILNSKWLFCLLLLFICSIYFTKSDRYYGWTNADAKIADPIISDGSSYYAYLPQWFIYHTSHFEFITAIVKKYPKASFGLNIYDQTDAGYQLNKCYTGTAIAQTPFFLIGHIQAKIMGEEQDGYSWPYLLWINLGGLCYFLLGAIGFYRLLRLYNIDRFWILFGIAMMAFATNLSYYTIYQIPYAHVYSFAIVTWILYLMKVWATNNSFRIFIWLTILIGFGLIIRPTNVLIVLFLPFLFNSWKEFWIRFKGLFIEKKIHLIIAMFIVSVFVLFQLIQSHSQIGKWTLQTYGGEGFDNWANPKIWSVLFSWNRGVFIYCPILLLLFPACIHLYRRHRFQFWGVLFFFSAITYIFSSWWCWTYGGGLGMRVYIDFLAVLFLPIVMLLNNCKAYAKILIISFSLLTGWIYHIYEYQILNHILHYETISKDQFARVFLKTDVRFAWSMYLNEDPIPAQAQSLGKKQLLNLKKEQLFLTYSHFTVTDSIPVYLYKLNLKQIENRIASKHFGVKIECDIFLKDPDENPYFIVQFMRKDTIAREMNLYFGHEIALANTWIHVVIPVEPDLIYGETFDYLGILPPFNKNKFKVKNESIEYFSWNN